MLCFTCHPQQFGLIVLSIVLWVCSHLFLCLDNTHGFATHDCDSRGSLLASVGPRLRTRASDFPGHIVRRRVLSGLHRVFRWKLHSLRLEILWFICFFTWLLDFSIALWRMNGGVLYLERIASNQAHRSISVNCYRMLSPLIPVETISPSFRRQMCMALLSMPQPLLTWALFLSVNLRRRLSSKAPKWDPITKWLKRLFRMIVDSRPGIFELLQIIYYSFTTAFDFIFHWNIIWVLGHIEETKPRKYIK